MEKKNVLGLNFDETILDIDEITFPDEITLEFKRKPPCDEVIFFGEHPVTCSVCGFKTYYPEDCMFYENGEPYEEDGVFSYNGLDIICDFCMNFV